MINHFLNDQNYTYLIQDLETIAKIQFGDKLAVQREGVQPTLVITEGGFLQASIRLYNDFVHGGYNRNAVAKHLETLASKTNNLVNQYDLQNPNFENISPAEYKKFTQLLKNVVKKLADTQYVYRKSAAGRNLAPTIHLFQEIKTFLKEKVKTNPHIFHLLPKEKIDFNAPINHSHVKLNLSRSHSIEDVLQLAQSAKKQIPPTWKKIFIYTAAFFSSLCAGLLLSLPTIFKILVWNPIEYLVRGEITTNTPLSWWRKAINVQTAKVLPKGPAQALIHYSCQLLTASELTDAYIQGFCQLADHVGDEVNLALVGLGSNNVDELLDMCTHEESMEAPEDLLNPGPIAKETLQAYIGNSMMELRPFYCFLVRNYAVLKWLDDPYWSGSGSDMSKLTKLKNDFRGEETDAVTRKNYCLSRVLLEPKNRLDPSVISARNLEKVIEAAAKNKQCKEFHLPLNAHRQPNIKAALEKGGFKQLDPRYDWRWSR